jgi:site-specific recombinase XerD
MNELIQTSSIAPNIEAVVLKIAKGAPTLASLNQEQLEVLAKMVMTQNLTKELSQKADIAKIDYAKKRETFLNDTKSAHTRRAYEAALCRLETWAEKQGKPILTMNAEDGDDFIRALKAEGRADASNRRDIAAVSAFFSFLERYHASIRNPIRGTRIRPKNTARRPIVIPDTQDMETITAALPPYEKAVIAVLAGRGLRAGALPTLERKKDGKYTGQSKGTSLNGKEGIALPQEAIAAIENAGLSVKKPFACNRDGEPMTANAIERRINHQIGKLYKNGKGQIKAAYSCHDFRHFFAITEYQKDRDIYRVSKLLNHAGIQITQTYLKSLGLEL